MVFISTSFAGDAVLLFIEVEPELVPAGLLPSVSGEDVEAMCGVFGPLLVYRREEKGRTNGRPPPDTDTRFGRR
jgi:hypothetical protein